MTLQEMNKKVKMADTLTWGGAVAIVAGYHLAKNMPVKVAIMGAGVAAEIVGVKMLYDVVKSEWDVADERYNKVKDRMDEADGNIIDVEWTIVESA